MPKINMFMRRWWIALLLMVIIFGFSSIPSTEMLNFGLLDLIVKKSGHALGYGLLALSYLRGLKGENKIFDKIWLFLAWFMAVLYSATDEFHQSFVPGRHPAATDVLIDALGATLALFLFNWLNRKVTNRKLVTGN